MNQQGSLLSAASPAWADCLRQAPHDVYHVPEYVVADARHQGGVPVAFRFSSGGRVLLVPLVLREVPGADGADAVSPYGYGGPVSDAPTTDEDFWCRATSSLVEVLAQEGVVSAFIRVHPLLGASDAALRRLGDVVEHGETVSVDLTCSDAEIWSATRASHRNEISRARRAGIVVGVDDWPLLATWTSLYHETMARLGADSSYFFTEDYFSDLHETLQGRVHLFLAHQGDDVVAGQLVFHHGRIVHTHLSATRSGTARLHADKLLYDEVRRWAKAQGARVHHLGGGVGGGTDGLFAFKSGFGTGRQPFRTWRVITDPAAYQRLTDRARTEGRLLAGDFFPAYRATSTAAAP